ncbi:hypothetical protein [Streptomyces sp. F-7]|uniref:hypothetical protein n=1 Tax=Streptomyces sp. F-7 TaxID=573566 RepID=UPI000AA27344|nr:hypothetical protein [Streptomyces sp. F-7]
MSTMTHEARSQMISEALAAVPDDADRRQLHWRGEDVSLPEVRIRVADVLLNPDSHRIKAQIRSLPPAARKAIEDDPFSKESQDKIADLIRATSGYADVKSVIARDKQQDPGLITHAGVLVNANTRAVVLRDLCKDLNHDDAKAFEYIKVQVLPSDAQPAEIVKLELGFQMRKNVQQDYTFTNRIIFIQDLLAEGLTPEQIGLEMYRSLDPNSAKDRAQAAKDIETEDRMGLMIQELIEASGGALKWEDFDSERQNLKDIDQAYQSLASKKGPDVARRVRQAKLAGMLAGLDYRKVRLIDETYLDDYVVAALEEDLTLRASARALAVGSTAGNHADASGLDPLVGLDPLDDFGSVSDTAAGDTVTLEPLFDLLVKSGKTSKSDIGATIAVPAEDGEIQLSRDVFFTAVFHAMAAAASQKERDNQGQDALDVPRRQLQAAATACDKARKGLDELADAGREVNRDAFRATYEAYLRSHDELVNYLQENLGFNQSEVASS